MDYEIANIYYDFNKYYIRPDAAEELDKLVQVMKENPVTIELGSHTDCRGSDEYNLDLSQKRAESAVRYIILQGIDASRITARGYGESRLVNHCADGVYCTPEEHQANRRTEFKVTGFNSSDTRNTFDMDKFIDGESIPVYMFDRDFFINCLQEKMADRKVSVGDIDEIQNEPKAKQPDYVTIPSETESRESNDVEILQDNGEISYRVQLFALSNDKSLTDTEFEGLESVYMYRQNGLYKFTAGLFSDMEQARRYRNYLLNLGFTDAFVVTFIDGKRWDGR